MIILIQPYAKALRNGERNPKNYPFWKELIEELVKIKHEIIQIGITGEPILTDDFRKDLSFKQLEELVNECDTFIGVDSFFQHLAWYHNKKGIVLWGQSDPLIFGHDCHINLLKNISYLRDKQFDLWEFTEYNQTKFREDCWVEPKEVIKWLNQIKCKNLKKEIKLKK